MKIYIVRHGETTWNKEEIFRGSRDVPLNETGIKQAERAGSYFVPRGVTAIYASPLQRAFQTAFGISGATEVPVETVDGFTDMTFGAWEGLSLDEVARRYPKELEIWKRWPQKFRMNGAENLGQVRKRIVAGLRRIPEEDGGVAVIVTHRVICKLLILHFMGMPNQGFWKIRCDPTGITLIEKKHEDITVCFMNDTCHLTTGDAGRTYADF